MNAMASFFFFDLQPPPPRPTVTPVAASAPPHSIVATATAPAVSAAAPVVAPATPSVATAVATTTATAATPATTAPAAAADTPDDRSDVYKAVDGTNGGEQFSGFNLMVEAYAVIWLIMLVWLGLMWRKQASLTARIDGLENAITRAERRATPAKPAASSSKEKTREPEPST